MTPELEAWMRRLEKQQRWNTALNALVIVALVVVVLSSCGSSPELPPAKAYYIGTPEPTFALALHLAADGMIEGAAPVASALAPGDGVPTGAGSPIPTPELEKPTEVVQSALTPAPAIKETPEISYSGQSVERWRGLVASIFPGWAVDTVLRIMACESGGDPNATGSAGERGLLQIHPIHHDSTYHPEGNLRAAYRISAGGSNWGAWSCRG